MRKIVFLMPRARIAGFGLMALACIAVPAYAQTACNATNRYTMNWDVLTPRNTALGTGPRNFVITNAAGGSVTVTMSFVADLTRYVDSGFGQTPNISVQNVGGIAAGENTLFLATDFVGYTTNLASSTNVAGVRFSFNPSVRDVNFKVLDIDFAAGQFRDWVRVSAANGVTPYVPNLSTPYGRNNTTNPGVTAPGVAAVGPTTVSGATIINGDTDGTGAATAAQDFGNIQTQTRQPVTYVEVRYGNGPASTMTGTAGVQSISVHDLTFCPLPNVTYSKTSAPVATGGTDPLRFNIPGADVEYTLTVTNSGGSTVDLNSTVLTDPLPANVTFFNGDIDTVSAGTQNFRITPGTSGLTLTAANVTYSATGPAPYTYTPGAGYDAGTRGIRFAPQGTMAANSSFSVTFRARIN